MARMFAVLALLALLPVSRVFGEGPEKAPLQLTCEIDLIEISARSVHGLLENQGPPADGLIPLDPIKAFFVRQADGAKYPRKNVYARSKATFPDGHILKFKGIPPRHQKEGAWPHGESYTFELTLKTDSPRSTIVTLKSRRDQKETLHGPTTVINDDAILILLDRSPAGDYFAALLAPRVINTSESEQANPKTE